MSSRAAQRYARAVCEVGRETGSLDKLAAEVETFASIVRKSEEFRHMAASPAVGEAARNQVLDDIADRLGTSDPTRRLVKLLGERGRLLTLPDVADELANMLDEDAGIVRATVRSATPLADGYRDRLRQRIERATGKKVLVTFEVDAALIGGVVTQVGDRVIDGSVRGKLDRLAESLRQG